MIEGAVNAAFEAVVTLPLLGPDGQSLEIDAVVDTGFSDFLTLPTSVVTELGLTYHSRTEVTLADGSAVSFDAYNVAVMWDGTARSVYAYAADNTPLLGMSLLEGHYLGVDVREGGRVLIQPAAER